MWDCLRMAWAIYWIIIGSFVQAQGFSTTVVKEGEDAIIDCGIQTKVTDGYLKWEAITNNTTVVLAYNVRDGHPDCDDRIINCTLHANGSIQLESVGKEDGASSYRCLRGDTHGYNYYSDHRLLVLPKGQMSSPPSIETPHRESVSAYDMDKKGVLHGYNAPVCEDDADGILPVVCYPPPGIIVDREYETIQCNCTDSDGQVDSVTFPVTSVTHWLHPGWRKAFISLLIISILNIFVLIWICCYHYKNLKMWKADARPDEIILYLWYLGKATYTGLIVDLKDGRIITTFQAKAEDAFPCTERNHILDDYDQLLINVTAKKPLHMYKIIVKSVNKFYLYHK